MKGKSSNLKRQAERRSAWQSLDRLLQLADQGVWQELDQRANAAASPPTRVSSERLKNSLANFALLCPLP